MVEKIGQQHSSIVKMRNAPLEYAVTQHVVFMPIKEMILSVTLKQMRIVLGELI